MRFILPIVLALIGTAAGVGAGVFLTADKPDAPDRSETESSESDDKALVDDTQASDTVKHDGPTDFVKLNNQFIIPVLHDDRVASLVILSLSLEVPEGRTEAVYSKEPRLRDAFLRVLFDHANIGGFDGAFTRSPRMEVLRGALTDTARNVVGDDLLAVLVTEISRQDN
ncbi:flagellar basal body-associated FliL family protein [Thalassococcus sp. CAU 1522]|uniref:Flagellar basal body-associated FliL family protein n=1 Tax=Thalassococcus arenae TaxID=2851652 RepID=A0ABS6N5P8_9RHOB|nr:flagellar basal body-associated FliL family protein [Thalassococcus arenae]MBV2359339.1 flagellar basal body-associated FliL family protein [Thalassococcus arenae]